MNVGIVVQNDYPHDAEVRPRKIAKALSRVGHKAVIISWNVGSSKNKEDIGYAHVYRFSYLQKSRFFQRISSPSPLNFLWTIWIRSIAEKECLDILIVSNIRIALPAILAAKLLRIPIILDLQENNPEVVKLRGKTTPVHYITRNSRIVYALEYLCIRLSDHTWVVVEERLEDITRWGIETGKISTINNVPDLDEIKIIQNPNLSENTFTLVYVGGITRLRGLDLIIGSIPYILEHNKHVKFLVIGDGDDRPRLEYLVKNVNIEEHVIFVGWVKSEEVHKWLEIGDVGVIPHRVSRFTNTTIPNKLFDYMSIGIPVLATDMKPVRRIVENEHCGIIIPLNSSYQEVANIILRLKRSPEEQAKMGKNGRKAVLERYNWNIEFKKILDILEELIARKV